MLDGFTFISFLKEQLSKVIIVDNMMNNIIFFIDIVSRFVVLGENDNFSVVITFLEKNENQQKKCYK